MIVIGFFTNWIDLEGYKEVTGFRLFTSINEINGAGVDGKHVVLSLEVSIVIIIVSALVSLAYMFGVKIARGAFIFFKILPLLVVIIWIYYVAVMMRQDAANHDFDDLRNSAWQILGVGIYLTVLGSLLLAVSRMRR